MATAAPPRRATTREMIPPRPSSSKHVPWIDNLRVAVISGVIVMHAATAYVVDVDWYYTERTASELSEMIFSYPALIGAVFGLGPLFLLAGMLSERALTKKGAASFALGRLLRLGVPLAAYVVVIGPLASYFGDRGMGARVDFWRSIRGDLAAPDLGPTWFIAALLGFTLAFAAVAAVRRGRPRSADAPIYRTAVEIALVVAVVSFIARLWIPLGEDAAYNLTLAEWPQAAGLFAFGVLVERRRWLPLTRHAERRWWWVAMSGIAIWTALATWFLFAGSLEPFLGGWHWQSAVSGALEGLSAVALSLAIVAWFQRRWNHAGSMGRRAGCGDYATYLLHPLVLVWLSVLMRPLPVSPEAKFALVGSTGVLAAFAVGYAVTLLPGLRRLL